MSVLDRLRKYEVAAVFHDGAVVKFNIPPKFTYAGAWNLAYRLNVRRVQKGLHSFRYHVFDIHTGHKLT